MLVSMKENIVSLLCDYADFPSEISSLLSGYYSVRSSLFKTIKEYTIKLKFKSQTYFLACRLLDYVVLSMNSRGVPEWSKNHFIKELDAYSVACLIVAGKKLLN